MRPWHTEQMRSTKFLTVGQTFPSGSRKISWLDIYQKTYQFLKFQHQRCILPLQIQPIIVGQYYFNAFCSITFNLIRVKHYWMHWMLPFMSQYPFLEMNDTATFAQARTHSISKKKRRKTPSLWTQNFCYPISDDRCTSSLMFRLINRAILMKRHCSHTSLTRRLTYGVRLSSEDEDMQNKIFR